MPLGRHPVERARAGLRARGLVEASLDFYQIVPSADLIFGILFSPTRKGACPGSPRQTDFPRRAGMAFHRRQPLRTWEALDGSLRNFTGMTREEDTALVQFHLLRCIIPGSLRHLIRCIGGGFRFPPPPMSGKENGRVALLSSAKRGGPLTGKAREWKGDHADDLPKLWQCLRS